MKNVLIFMLFLSPFIGMSIGDSLLVDSTKNRSLIHDYLQVGDSCYYKTCLQGCFVGCKSSMDSIFIYKDSSHYEFKYHNKICIVPYTEAVEIISVDKAMCGCDMRNSTYERHLFIYYKGDSKLIGSCASSGLWKLFLEYVLKHEKKE